jgi:hypothetical protein
MIFESLTGASSGGSNCPRKSPSCNFFQGAFLEIASAEATVRQIRIPEIERNEDSVLILELFLLFGAIPHR